MFKGQRFSHCTLEMTEMCNVICLFRFVTLHFRNHTEILNVRNYFFMEMTEMCNVICLFRFVTLHFRNHTEILNVRNYFFIYRYINYINIKYRPPASSTFSMC